MKNDSTLLLDVIDELTLDPAIEGSEIGVAAKDGVVTLSGTVRSFAEKLAAERALKRVSGVRGIAEELKVEIPLPYQRSDADIARAAIMALDWDATVPKGKVSVKVENGWLSLTGTVIWPYQKAAARRAVDHLIGVCGVSDAISVMPALVLASDVEAKILKAFERSAEIDSKKVSVEVVSGVVTLRGDVHSWSEHDDAMYAAYCVPGVRSVHNYTQVV